MLVQFCEQKFVRDFNAISGKNGATVLTSVYGAVFVIGV